MGGFDRRRGAALAVLALAALAALSARARAQGGRAVRFPGFYVGTGLVTIDPQAGHKDTLRYLGIRSEFPIDAVRVGIDAHLRFEDRNIWAFDLRERDWDEPSDFARWIDYIEYGRPGDAFSVRIARLRDGRLGHGTLLDHYQGWLDFDSPRTGAELGVELGWIGAEGIVDDIVAPEVLGGRVSLRPFHSGGLKLEEPEPAVTAQIVSDLHAPIALRRDGLGRPKLNDDHNLRTRNDALTAWGIGLDLPPMHVLLDMMPYLEWNRIENYGEAWHAGADFAMAIPGSQASMLARVEWSRTTDRYVPTYFNALYEIDRFRFPRLESATTRREVLARTSARNGYLAQGRLMISSFDVQASYLYVDTEEHNNLFVLSATLEGSDSLWARVFYVRRGATQLPELFSVNDGTTIGVDLTLRLGGGLYLDGGYTRSYVMNDAERRFRPLDVYTAALLFGTRF